MIRIAAPRRTYRRPRELATRACRRPPRAGQRALKRLPAHRPWFRRWLAVDVDPVDNRQRVARIELRGRSRTACRSSSAFRARAKPVAGRQVRTLCTLPSSFRGLALGSGRSRPTDSWNESGHDPSRSLFCLSHWWRRRQCNRFRVTTARPGSMASRTTVTIRSCRCAVATPTTKSRSSTPNAIRWSGGHFSSHVPAHRRSMDHRLAFLQEVLCYADVPKHCESPRRAPRQP